MTTRLTLLLAATLIWPGTTPASPESHRQAVETLFRLTQMEQKINEGVQSVAQLQLRQDPALAGKQDVLTAFLEKYIGWNAIRDELTDMYMQTFSEDELQAMNDFYATPTGQKVITIVPQLVAQRNQLAMQRLQTNIGELRAAIGQDQSGK
ncbi:MAG: DUF2059 domain-containing protein [Pseudomonadota bacterium]